MCCPNYTLYTIIDWVVQYVPAVVCFSNTSILMKRLHTNKPLYNVSRTTAVWFMRWWACVPYSLYYFKHKHQLLWPLFWAYHNRIKAKCHCLHKSMESLWFGVLMWKSRGPLGIWSDLREWVSVTEPAYNFDPTTIVCTKQRATSDQIAHISVHYSNIVLVINTWTDKILTSSSWFATSEVKCR